MGSDFWIVLQWWGSLFLVGAVAWPLTKKLFAGWWDEGYLFSKAVGMAAVAWIVYVLGTIKLVPFGLLSIIVALGAVFFSGIAFHLKAQSAKRKATVQIWKTVVEELFFLVALLFWSWVKAHEPELRGLEKFMDFGFMQSILNSAYFPPADMWYAGEPINYYYFGHLVTAVLTKLSGLDLAYAFTLMLATIFALTLTMSFSIGKQIGGGILTAFLVTLSGNMQTIYAFIKGLTNYWYADATRFIPYTIHEFPGYSFVVSDVHGHVLSIPFVLLAIAMLIRFSLFAFRFSLLFYGFLVGVLLMTNALDGPIYLGLFAVVLGVQSAKCKVQSWKTLGIQLSIVLIVAGLTSLPFLWHFKSFVSGVAVNCPPGFLANTKIGPLIFEGVEKCQISPLWMWWLLWGFFVYCGGVFLYNCYKHYKNYNNYNRTEKVLTIFFLFALGLVIFPEFLYFKDIYPAHFRSNTMFKLGYQAFILFSIVAGYTIVTLRRSKIFFLLLLPQLFLVSIFPIFSVRSYFGGLKNYEGIEGFGWMRREYTDDWEAIQWLKGQVESRKARKEESQNFTLYALRFTLPVIVEADGDSYTDYGRFSAFTGMPTIIGWPVHEWLWRGSYDVVAPRREDVRLVYESEDLEVTRAILARYAVRYVVVGKLEREKFKSLQERKFGELGVSEAFRAGETVIYALEAK